MSVEAATATVLPPVKGSRTACNATTPVANATTSTPVTRA